MEIDPFITSLKRCPFWPDQGVFNPWRDVDPGHDTGPSAPQIRRRQLRHYLTIRRNTAKFCLIGEALSYQGGHFTGMAMTSERILLGFKSREGIVPEHVLPGMRPQRTSRPDIKPDGFTENTASVVWKQIIQFPEGPAAFVLWNAFAWHPFDLKKGLLSNRRPAPREIKAARPQLEAFMRLFPRVRYFAVGAVAAGELKEMGMAATPLRHPSMHGAGQFRRQISAALQERP